MRKLEKNYEFRKRMMQIHKKDIVNVSIMPGEDELVITDGFVIDISQTDSDVVLTAAKDFQEYMLISMNVSVMIARKKETGKKVISIDFDKEQQLTTGNGYMGYRLSVEESIKVLAHDERGVAQALYRMEDMMTLRKAPFLKKETIECKAAFSPRMVHSGYGIDQFPDCHLRDIAHAGMDAILVFTKGSNMTTYGFLDFNELVCRAAKYGIDVYAYSYLKSEMHPDDEGAYDYYDGSYGKLFRECPGLKGVVLVGESVAFPSHDPNTTGSISRKSPDGIPNLKTHPGWWPCCDYPDWLNLLKKVIRKYNSEADIVFWTYNWGGAPEIDRIKLIESLPEDISLLATFEKSEIYEKNGVMENVSDYTLSLTGPGKCFLSEAKAAKENGIRLYAMANTAGLTWDFGVIPYEPFPYQWQKRYDALLECREEYGLCGLMESHHYGFYPSFISEFAKWSFTISDKPRKNILKELLGNLYGEENVEKVNEAMLEWSEAITHYIAVCDDQYGAFRIGPAYPFCMHREIKPPQADYAHFGTGILTSAYYPFFDSNTQISVSPIRIHREIKSFEVLEHHLLKGINILESIELCNDELEELIELGKFIACTVRSVINVKTYTVARTRLYSSDDPNVINKYIKELEKIALLEIDNAKSAIPLVQKNSRLGWEPSMEYLGDEEHIKWKIRQMEYLLNFEINALKEGIKHNLTKEVYDET